MRTVWTSVPGTARLPLLYAVPGLLAIAVYLTLPYDLNERRHVRRDRRLVGRRHPRRHLDPPAGAAPAVAPPRSRLRLLRRRRGHVAHLFVRARAGPVPVRRRSLLPRGLPAPRHGAPAPRPRPWSPPLAAARRLPRRSDRHGRRVRRLLDVPDASVRRGRNPPGAGPGALGRVPPHGRAPADPARPSSLRARPPLARDLAPGPRDDVQHRRGRHVPGPRGRRQDHGDVDRLRVAALLRVGRSRSAPPVHGRARRRPLRGQSG